MKIKVKLRLGFGFLFIVVLLFGAVSIFYIHEISENAKVILKNNYESLSYAREMRSVLDDNSLPLNTGQINQFDKQLAAEEHNITEIGEKEAASKLRQTFQSLKSAPATQQAAIERAIRQHLKTIDVLNMNAIVRKNARAQAAVDRATLFLGIAGSIAFLILFSFSVNFPDIIAAPLKALQEGIREISQKNYSQRLDFEKNDEFGEVATAFNHMAVRLNEWESSNLAEIKSEKLRIETIIEQMQDAIIGLNEKDIIIFINPVAEQIFNLDKKKVVGQNVSGLIKTNDLLKTAVESDQGAKPYKIFANNKESYFQLENREILVPTIPSDTDVLGTTCKSAGRVIILRNITEFKELDEAKTNFIATISHELKTPMSSINMSLKLLNDDRIGALNNEQQDLVNNVKGECDRLLKITSELLDLSQAETGNLRLNIVQADPVQIVDYAVDSVRFQAEQKDVKLEVHHAPTLPKIQVDVEKTAWVLINFLSNALRYSPEKSRVVIDTREKDHSVEFSVKDFGKGIDEQYQKRLFDRYFQVPTDGQSKAGTGLGLAISKDFIESEHGKIGVESAIGEGSRFWFSLPTAE